MKISERHLPHLNLMKDKLKVVQLKENTGRDYRMVKCVSKTNVITEKNVGKRTNKSINLLHRKKRPQICIQDPMQIFNPLTLISKKLRKLH